MSIADHRIGTREEWQAAREQLLEREKEHTRLGDGRTGTPTPRPAVGPGGQGVCSGRRQSELAARSHARPMSSAPRCGQTRKTTTRERTNP